MDALHWCWLSVLRKSLMGIVQECYKLYGTNIGSDIPQNSSWMVTYHPSQRLSKLDKQGMHDTAGGASMNA